jgi:hypothetical protein
VTPLTSALLGSVEKSRSGVAAGVLNSARQTGSVLGVALFGSLIGGANAFLFGTKAALVISTLLLVIAAATTVIGGSAKKTHTKICSGLYRSQNAIGVFAGPGEPSDCQL